MTEIVERLRIGAREPCDGCCYDSEMLKAADEIERLWEALSWLEDHEPQLVDAAKEKFGIK